MRNDFCAFILTNGRPNTIITPRALELHGYTGKVFIVIDDEDETGEEYKKIYGDNVLVFSKNEVAKYTDELDNFKDRRSAVWARNACWDLARQMGYRFFVLLDDDYTHFLYKRLGKGHKNSITSEKEYHAWKMGNLDAVFESLIELVEITPITTIAFSQGGEHIGGNPLKRRFKRKAMNSFFCDVEKPFLFKGRFNDDVNTYVSLGCTGALFFTDWEIVLVQLLTQSNSGGMTEAYQKSGTYVKSFYTVIVAPSCTTINFLVGGTSKRLHHKINWNKAVPKILSERIKQ